MGKKVDILENQIDILIQKIKHYLITVMGRTIEESTDEEFYHALCWSLREDIMINWTATNHTFAKKKIRKTYYLSMEYMPGRLLGNNLSNLSHMDLIQGLFKKVNRSFARMMWIEPEIGIGNGGLGRLASCFLDSLATQEYPAMGYGLRYQYGIFEQEIIKGIQTEKPDCWLLLVNPWEFRRDSNAVYVHFAGTMKSRFNSRGCEVFDLFDSEEVRALPYDFPIVGYSNASNFPVLTLRIWSTKDSPRNFLLQRFNAGDTGSASENTGLTDVLYPNDNNETGKRIRLKQEFLLVTASLQDIINEQLSIYGNLDLFADKVRIQINDTHPSMAIAELIHLLTHHHEKSWDEAFEITKTVCSFTNHTVLKESLEEWNVNRMRSLMPRQYEIITRINEKFVNEIRKQYPGNIAKIDDMTIIKGDQIKMAHLAVYGCHHINGVAKLHSELLKHHVFKDFYEMFPERFINVTNGVTQRRWLNYCNPLLAEFISERIGYDWILDFSKLIKLKDFASDKASQDRLIAIKQLNKKHLVEQLSPQLFERNRNNYDEHYNPFLPTDALFDVQIKRIHEYKRQFMSALHALMLFQEILETGKPRAVKRMIIFAGKAAPGYELAKNVIRFIYILTRTIQNHPIARNALKIAFIDNYNVSKAEIIIPGADLSEQISTASTEASGTGNMKLTINGALTIATDDGANIEMKEAIGEAYWPFLFGLKAEENIKLTNSHQYNVQDILDKNPSIRKAVHALIDGSLGIDDEEKKCLRFLYGSLVEGIYGSPADRYFALNDLSSYATTQRKVEELFADQSKWAEMVIHNIAGMGPFSTDRSINDYATKIWNLEKCPVDQAELNKIRQDYVDSDKCRITY
jgi:starch phosphorylase